MTENEIHPEQEDNENQLYSACVVLGGGFRRDKPQVLSLESKFRSLAAGALAQEGAVKTLIFTGGKTRKGQDSEAQAMKEYMLSKYPELAEFDVKIITEDDSLHTRENARLTVEKLKLNQQGSAIILSNGFHLKRAQEEFASFGIDTEGMTAEDLVIERSPSHEKLIERYLKSKRMKKLKATEIILTAMQRIDPDGKMVTALAKAFRNANLFI